MKKGLIIEGYVEQRAVSKNRDKNLTTSSCFSLLNSRGVLRKWIPSKLDFKNFRIYLKMIRNKSNQYGVLIFNKCCLVVLSPVLNNSQRETFLVKRIVIGDTLLVEHFNEIFEKLNFFRFYDNLMKNKFLI